MAAKKNSNKTIPTTASVTSFLDSVSPEQRQDCKTLSKMMREATGKRAKMWGSSIVGFDQYHYRYDSGREGDHMITGYSPRKQNLAVYIMPGFSKYESLLKKLGRYKTGKSCLYIKKLDDVDTKVLQQLIERSVKDMRKKYPAA